MELMNTVDCSNSTTPSLRGFWTRITRFCGILNQVRALRILLYDKQIIINFFFAVGPKLMTVNY